MNPAGVRPPSGAQSVVTPSYLPPPISQSSPGGLAPSLEEILLSMPNPRHRQVISDLRSNNIELQRYVTELQAELSTLRNRCASLESQVQESHEKPVSVPAPVKSLEDLISGLRQQFLQRIETIRRTGAEDVRNADDSSFDAPLVVHQTLSKTMRPIPKSFEFIDLMALRDSLQQEGTAPNGPLQAPLIVEFVSHLDAVRQCTRDGRIAHMHRDPIKQDTLRRLFDACKSVEAKVSNPQHLALPPQSISIDYAAIAPTDVLARRTKEFHSHTESIEKCGEIFELACRDVRSLDEQFNQVVHLPTFVAEFDILISSTQNDVENLLQNEGSVKEISAVLTEQQKSQKDYFTEQSVGLLEQLDEKKKTVEVMFDQMRLLLLQSEQAYDVCVELMSKSCRHQVDGAQCDYRMKQINKAIEVELVQQQKYLEGTRFTTFLASKAKELYKKLYTNMEESMRSRREMCERTKMSSQEQLYSMAENLHDVITKRMSQDNLQIRTDQGQLDTANRSLMGLVHVPNEMEKQMDIIRRLTLDISSAKHRMNQSQADIGTIRQILTKYGTLQFLKRDSNFLSVFDGVERQAKLKERLDDVVLKVKFVSEVLVEIADPETRQDYVVQQALEALKTSVTDLNELLPQKSKMEDLDEQFRVNTATRLKRHKRLLAHFLDEIREGTNDLSTKEPAVEVHCVAMMDNLQVVLSALTHNEEPVPPHLRTAYLQGASSGQAPQQSYYDSAGGVGGAGVANGGGGPGGDMGGQKFGGGVGGGGRSLASSETHGAFDTASAEQIRHTFARYSERLKVSQESTRLTKISGGMEMSNTSALGAVGFRLNSGIHFFAIRIGANCSRLLVGFADWNLPLDGYCNSIKYPACYYLHIGNGTLWAPDQKVERKAYTYESIGSSVGGVLQCIVNTNDRSISYIFNEMNLGIAFRNVNLSRTLYPAFEVFSNNCTVEFTMLAQNGAKKE